MLTFVQIEGITPYPQQGRIHGISKLLYTLGILLV
uniref:Uncharacterized protein n=1 Tax=Arundo donax TaxID=35708 RepID=A0A0A9H443_ARUDO